MARPGRSTRRILPGALGLLVAIAVGLSLGVGIDIVRNGGWQSWLARHGLLLPYRAEGDRYDVGGRSLYLDCRGSGSPTVVLEAGSGADSSTWSAVIDPLATTTRTCAYDRAGRGRSDSRGDHTLADAATDLWTLLAVAGERGPFVVVGHSLGGAYGRVFAAAHRTDVAGLVLVDTFDPDILEDRIHPLLGSLRAEYEADLDGLRDIVSRVDGLDMTVSEAQLRASRLDGIAIEVLTAARYEPRLDAATNAAVVDARTRAFESLSPGNVRVTIAYGVGHMIQVERPDLVIDAARRLIDRARGG
jgi:pimeloyl-ACP methyl ester carboxylesterase